MQEGRRQVAGAVVRGGAQSMGGGGRSFLGGAGWDMGEACDRKRWSRRQKTKNATSEKMRRICSRGGRLVIAGKKEGRRKERAL